jgi:predicted nucleic acid-binding Zn ribbon protein
MSTGADAPEPLSSALDRLSRRLGGPSSAVLRTIFGRWEELVGPAVAAHVQPLSLRGTTLVVAADAPAWATQMAFLGPDLAKKVNEDLGVPTVTSVETRVRAPRTPSKGRE